MSSITNHNSLSHFIIGYEESKNNFNDYKKLLEKNNNYDKSIEVSWLGILTKQDCCQFCDTPEGSCKSYYIGSPLSMVGYKVCEKKECNDKINKHIGSIFDTVYRTNAWRRVLYFAANNIKIRVERTNGTIDNDWFIMNKYDNDTVHNLNANFSTMLLCLLKMGLYERIPFEIYENIYKICIDSYKKDVKFEFSNSCDLIPLIGVCKNINGKLMHKMVPLETI